MYSGQEESPFREMVGKIALGVFVVCVGLIFAKDYLGKKEEPSKPWDFRTFDRPIVAGAPGCEIRSPQGELMNEIFKDAKPNTLTLEKGTSFTIDCFPIQQSEKSTTIDPQTSNRE